MSLITLVEILLPQKASRISPASPIKQTASIQTEVAFTTSKSLGTRPLSIILARSVGSPSSIRMKLNTHKKFKKI